MLCKNHNSMIDIKPFGFHNFTLSIIVIKSCISLNFINNYPSNYYFSDLKCGL